MKKPSDSPFPPIPEDRFHRNALLLKVVDGDTLDVEIDLGWSMKLKERLRLEGLNTPEVRGKAEREAGKWVKQRVEKILKKGSALIITSMAYDRTGNVRGKYGRTLAVVYNAINGDYLNKYLIEKKLAWPVNERGSLVGKRDLALLTGLPLKLRKRN